MYLAKEAKIVLANVPVDINNLAVTGDYVSMKSWHWHCINIETGNRCYKLIVG